MIRRRRPVIFAAFAAALLFALAAQALFADAPAVVSGSTLILEDGVLDLRANAQMREASGAAIGGYASVTNLQVGSIFISPDDAALRVVSLSQSGGSTVIETDQPAMQDVIAAYDMPDQQITFTAANIVPGSVQPGVTILPSTPASGAAAPARSLAQGPTWINTDTNSTIQGNNMINVSFNIPIASGQGKTSTGEDESSNANTGSGVSTHAGGSTTTETTASGDVSVKGTLSIADPILNGGMKLPEMHVRWVQVWWYVGYPEVTFDTGYIHASFNSGEQIDAQLTGSVTLTREITIPLYDIQAQDSSGDTKFVIGLYIKVSITGQITVAFEVNQYARLGLWGTVDLAWPFIPYDIETGSDFYYNFAARPTISASVSSDAGPYLGMTGTVLGYDILTAELGGGIYANVTGSIEPTDVIGVDENVGGYGSFSNWIYKGSAEVGGFLKLTLGIATFTKDLVDQKWPFLQLSGQGTL